MCPKCFLKITRNQTNTDFFNLTSSNFVAISHINNGNSRVVYFAEINQVPYPYPMLRLIGRVATPKLIPINCLRYLQTTLVMGEFM